MPRCRVLRFEFIDCCPVKVIKIVISILWCCCNCCWLHSCTCADRHCTRPLLLLTRPRWVRLVLLLLLARPCWLFVLLLLLLHCVAKVLLEGLLPQEGLQHTCCCARL
jgi:hypothetical protein